MSFSVVSLTKPCQWMHPHVFYGNLHSIFNTLSYWSTYTTDSSLYWALALASGYIHNNGKKKSVWNGSSWIWILWCAVLIKIVCFDKHQKEKRHATLVDDTHWSPHIQFKSILLICIPMAYKYYNIQLNTAHKVNHQVICSLLQVNTW